MVMIRVQPGVRVRNFPFAESGTQQVGVILTRGVYSNWTKRSPSPAHMRLFRKMNKERRSNSKFITYGVY